MEKKMHPLMRYLKLGGISVTDFAESVGMSRMNLYRIMNGKDTNFSRIVKICEKTKGEVTMEDFATFRSEKVDVA